jgi:hypothetical protein
MRNNNSMKSGIKDSSANKKNLFANLKNKTLNKILFLAAGLTFLASCQKECDPLTAVPGDECYTAPAPKKYNIDMLFSSSGRNYIESEVIVDSAKNSLIDTIFLVSAEDCAVLNADNFSILVSYAKGLVGASNGKAYGKGIVNPESVHKDDSLYMTKMGWEVIPQRPDKTR